MTMNLVCANEHTYLDEGERSAVLDIAERLTGTAPGLLDDPEWLAEARNWSCDLPATLRRALRDFAADSGREGSLRIHGLPVGTARPTPTDTESVERSATVAASTLVLCALALGEIVSYRAEKHGATVHNVVPVRGDERTQSNAGSRVMMEMHIENAFHPYRPDYVVLYCVRRDHDGTGGLRVASCRRVLDQLSPAERTILSEPRFRTEPPPSFNGHGETVAHPIFSGAPEDPDVRVDFNATAALDPTAAATMATLRDALEAVTETVYFQPGELAIVDNRVALHGRTAFTPRYDGRDRWLHRTFVHVDGRPSRVLRAGGGHIIA
jgi:L-asparagine oxygenase